METNSSFQRNARTYLERHLTPEELAEISGLSQPRSWRLQATIAFALEHQEVGLSLAQIGKRAALSPWEVNNWLRQRGSPFRLVFAPSGSYKDGPYRFYRQIPDSQMV